MIRSKISLVTLTVAGLLGCASSAIHPSKESRTLVGLWRETFEDKDAVVLRKSDGTYLEKIVQIYDLSKPAASFDCVGTWRLKGKDYVIEYSRASNPIIQPVLGEPRYDNTLKSILQKSIGRPIRFPLIKITPDSFTYWSTDGAVVTERKIGEASEIEFNQAKVALPKAQ